MLEAYCRTCNQEVDTTTVDSGIGTYEFWGSLGVDTQIVVVCKVCEGNDLAETDDHDKDYEPPTEDDYEPDDTRYDDDRG